MPNFEALYYMLFAQTANALEAIEQRNYGIAENILISAQQEAEELFLADEDDA